MTLLQTFIVNLGWLLSRFQPPPSSAGAASGGQSGGAAPASCGDGGWMTWAYLGFFGVLMYMLIAPQRKEAKLMEALQKGLEEGDIVRTSSGIRGKVVRFEDSDVVLKIAEKTNIRILRSNITGKVSDNEESSKDR